MNIEYREDGSLFDDNAEAIVNPVNCVGVMGAGVAKQFKEKYPDNFDFYLEGCLKGVVQLGHVFVFDQGRHKPMPRYVVNFPTKKHWKDRSYLFDIQNGLASLKCDLVSRSISSVALPALGCGLGGLKWPEVNELIFRMLNNLTAKIIVYKPQIDNVN